MLLHLQFGRTALYLGAPLLEPLTRVLLGHVLSRVGCCSLGLVGPGSFVLVPPRKWEVRQDDTR